MANPLQLAGALFSALFGLAFGSFLNVFLTRFPEEESIVTPRSHCRHCDHVLAWWENLPLLSWIVLRGRCRSCQTWIGIRYPAVELAVAILWAACWLRFAPSSSIPGPATTSIAYGWIHLVGSAILCWFLVALAVLDAEYFWLPDRLTYPGFAIGFVLFLVEALLGGDTRAELLQDLGRRLLAIAAAAGMILFIRLAYWLVRRKEGMGLGDAKLMAMLAAWLGLSGTLESFVLAILIATFAALLWLAVLIVRRDTEGWATMPLPFGTFLCAAALFPIFHSTWNLRGVLLNIQN